MCGCGCGNVVVYVGLGMGVKEEIRFLLPLLEHRANQYQYVPKNTAPHEDIFWATFVPPLHKPTYTKVNNIKNNEIFIKRKL